MSLRECLPSAFWTCCKICLFSRIVMCIFLFHVVDCGNGYLFVTFCLFSFLLCLMIGRILLFGGESWCCCCVCVNVTRHPTSFTSIWTRWVTEVAGARTFPLCGALKLEPRPILPSRCENDIRVRAIVHCRRLPTVTLYSGERRFGVCCMR